MTIGDSVRKEHRESPLSKKPTAADRVKIINALLTAGIDLKDSVAVRRYVLSLGYTDAFMRRLTLGGLK